MQTAVNFLSVVIGLVIYIITAYFNKKINNTGFIQTGIIYFITFLLIRSLFFCFENQYVYTKSKFSTRWRCEMIHHYITKYEEKGTLYAEAWMQIDLFGKSFCISKKKIAISTANTNR